MACLQSPSITDHPEYRNWTPLSGRLKCFEKLRKHLELIYPITKDEIKVESGSFLNLVLNAIQNNSTLNNTSKKNYNNDQVDISLLKFIKNDINNNNNINYNNNNEKSRKIYNAYKNKISIEDDLDDVFNNINKNEKNSKEENEAFMRKSNSSLKAIRNERISQSLNLNKIAEIDQENYNEDDNNNDKNEEISNQFYEEYESNQKKTQADKINNSKSKNIKVNEIDKSAQNEFDHESNGIRSNNDKNNYLNINSKSAMQYNHNSINKNAFYNNEINVIEEEERSKKDEEIDLDDIDENMEIHQNSLSTANNYNNQKNYNYPNQIYNHTDILKENIKNKNNMKNFNNNKDNNINNINDYNIKFQDQNYNDDDSNLDKLNIVEEDENNNLESNNNQSINENALSDLDKEEYFMKSCYDFFDYDITTLAERKVIEDSHPIRTSCFSSRGDYFAIGTNSKSIKLFHIKPVLQRFNKKNSYNFKNDLQLNSNNQKNILFNNNNNTNNKGNLNYNFNNINNGEIDDIKMVFEQANHHMGSIYCLDWSLSGRLIASGSNDRLIKLMVVPSLDESLYGKDYETLELIINGHEGTVRSVCFEPTNDLILLSGGICKILLMFFLFDKFLFP